MQFVIVDCFLQNRGGHHYNLARTIRGELARRGIESESIAHKSCPESLGESLSCLPLFEYDRAIRSKDPFASEYETFHLRNNQFYRDLQKIPQDRLSKDTVLLFPAITQHETLGLSRWLAGLPSEARPFVLLFFTANCGIEIVGDKVRVTNKERAGYYRIVLKALQRLEDPRVALFADTEALAAHFAALSGAEVTAAPTYIPCQTVGPEKQMTTHDRAGGAATRPPIKVLLYLGDIRPIKGFNLLPDVCETLLTRLDQVTIEVQVNQGAINFTGGDLQIQRRRVQRSIKRLLLLEKTESRLTLLHGFLSQNEYCQAFFRSDLIVLTHCPKGPYGIHSSGMMWEALYLGKPLVVPERTEIQRLVEKYGNACVAFPEWTPDSISRSVVDAVERMSDLEKRAASGRAEFRKQHGTEKFVDALLGRVRNG